MTKKTLRYGSLLLFLLSLLPNVVVSAASGINVAPASLTISLSARQPTQEASVGVRNDFDKPIDMTTGLRAVDQNSGTLSPNIKVDATLEKIITVEPTIFTLQPKQSINIKLTFKDNDQLSPGGHYAALLLRQVNTSSGVGLQPAVAVNLYIIKEDGAIRNLNVNKPRLPNLAFWLPNRINLTVNNTGNVLLIPRLALSLEHDKRIVASTAINQNSQSIYPGHNITFSTKINSGKSIRLPGRYDYLIRYRYDGSSNIETVKYSIWYLPWQGFVAIGCLIIIVYWQRHRLKKVYKRIF